jgi:two-component system chemotaxis response regulator CheY
MALRVLVVDDSLVARSLLKEFIDCCGHQVVAEAETLQGSLDAYREHKPDLVTLDLSLADTDGVTVLKALRAMDPNARVLVVSANVEGSVHEAVQAAGAVGFLSKPFSLADVNRVLTRFSAP